MEFYMAKIKEVSAKSENVAVIKCPKCDTSRTVDMSKHIAIDDVIRFTARCKCGYSYKVVLNKRDKFRKKTNLYGSYTNLSSGKEGQKGQMEVLDVSRSGIKIKKINQMRLKIEDHDLSSRTAGKAAFALKILNSSDDLNVGDIILVEFQLDNAKRSMVSKEVVIRWIDKPYIGIEFTSIPEFDADLGFYMMS